MYFKCSINLAITKFHTVETSLNTNQFSKSRLQKLCRSKSTETEELKMKGIFILVVLTIGLVAMVTGEMTKFECKDLLRNVLFI